MKNHKTAEKTDKNTERNSGRMEPRGRERAKTARPPCASPPSQPGLISAQEMALCKHEWEEWEEASRVSKQLYPLVANSG